MSLQSIEHGQDARGAASITAIPISSKFSSRRSKNEFYRYYAGYPLEFAEWALGKLDLSPGALIIDPWNGSGTTAAACARLGVSCRGYDINPVMVHLGRARVAATVDFVEAAELVGSLSILMSSERTIDLKGLGKAFHQLSIQNKNAHSVAISALFPIARKLLVPSKTKNPSWYKTNSTLEDTPIICREFFDSWLFFLDELARWRNTQEGTQGNSIVVEHGDSRKSLGHKSTFDGILTSPPYLTRIDYVHATLPEFLILKELGFAPDIQRLRRSMLGSPLTSERPKRNVERLPDSIRDLLRRIEKHSSKASATYYYRFFSTYFVDLQASMRNIAKVLKDNASGCIVVQSTNYKEIEIDLAAAVVSLGEDFGLRYNGKVEFKTRRSISLLNTRAHKDARRPKSECAVFIRKA